MKIHSKFHDYYDVGLSYGYDDRIHYVREEKQATFDRSSVKRTELSIFHSDLFYHRPSTEWRTWSGLELRTHFIGFCGKIYPVFDIRYQPQQANKKGKAEPIFDHVYTSDQFKKFLHKIDPKGKRVQTLSTYPKHEISFVHLDEYLDKFDGSDQFVDMFFESKVPIFIIKTGRGTWNDIELTLNPMLKRYKFQRKIDPVTAYQEIEMFMSGVLGLNDPETVDIEDKYLAQQKGFDEWSFKKLPTKRRKS